MVRIAAAVLAVLFLATGSRGEEERPRIYLEKKIFAETSEGKKSFYEVHTVSEGESLWKILRERSPLFPADYPSLLREFRRGNPGIRNPGKLVPGQKIMIPAGAGMRAARLVEGGKSVPYRIRKGDSLSEILAARGVAGRDLPRYLDAVKEVNPSIRDVDRIYAGNTILVPTEDYFSPTAGPADAETVAMRPPVVAPSPPPTGPPTSSEAPPVALTRDAESPPGTEAIPPASPESQVSAPAPPLPEAAAVMTGTKQEKSPTAPLPQPKPPYRGLLADLVRGLGETWVDRGTLYLPLPSGGEVVLDLADYPVVRFSGGVHALIDFRNTLPHEVRRLIVETWKNYRIVPMAGASDAEDMIDRLLGASGYYSVKDGRTRPPVIGEEVSVSLPARWVILRTSRSLLAGEILLVKHVPEKPGPDLSAVLRYAERVGIRVLPFTYDPSANEGFLAGLEPEPAGTGTDAGKTMPTDGLEALDVSLDLLGIPKSDEKRIRIGGGKESFLLTVQPERIFETGGKTYVADSAKMSPALRSIVKNSGYEVFELGRDESGISILSRLLSVSGISFEERKAYLLAGGPQEGFEVRATGIFITSRPWLERNRVREMVIVRGKTHSATRELLREIGVEIVGR